MKKYLSCDNKSGRRSIGVRSFPIRRGVTPEINAIGTMVLAVSLTLLVAAQFLLRARARQARAAG